MRRCGGAAVPSVRSGVAEDRLPASAGHQLAARVQIRPVHDRSPSSATGEWPSSSSHSSETPGCWKDA